MPHNLEFTIPDAPRGLNVREAYVHVVQKYLVLSEAVADGKRLAVTCVWRLKCAFCQNWRSEEGEGCIGCPVQRKTKLDACVKTPFYYLENTVEFETSNVPERLVDEIVFLLSLEPTVKSMEKK